VSRAQVVVYRDTSALGEKEGVLRSVPGTGSRGGRNRLDGDGRPQLGGWGDNIITSCGHPATSGTINRDVSWSPVKYPVEQRLLSSWRSPDTSLISIGTTKDPAGRGPLPCLEFGISCFEFDSLPVRNPPLGPITGICFNKHFRHSFLPDFSIV
jgi:hypothetical protein